jgi:hypothetical protein
MSMTVHALTTVLMGLGAAFVTLAVHELGHLVAGLAVGFRFSLFAIGPLLVERAPSGRIRLAWNREPGLFGGVAGTIPVGPEVPRWRFAVNIAGGPCASLFLALGAAAVLAWTPVPHGLLRSALGWLRLLSAAIFVGTAFPLPNGPFVTDGLRFLRLLGRGPHGDRELSLLTLASAEQGGLRPRDWDASLIERGRALRDGSIFECQMHLYAYMHALDSGSFPAAKAALEQALSLGVSDLVRAPCLVEAAYFAAAHDGDPRRARELLAGVRPRAFGVLESDRLRAQAAIALAEGDSRSANETLARALAVSPRWATGPRAWLAALGGSAGSLS